ncbi:MAG: PadR family transcriptional regulator [Candidatus Micrarchaeaceae archaeon]
MRQENSLDKDMKMIMLKFYILGKISENSKANPYALIKKIGSCKGSGRMFGEKTEVKDSVYNAVNCLEHSGYIKASQKIEDGRLKKYYSLTSAGKDALKTGRRMFSKSVSEMVSAMDR